MRLIFCVATILLTAQQAHASLMTTASLYSPAALPGALTSVVDLTNVSPSSQATLVRPGYSVSFRTDADEGVVRGAVGGRYAIPVAGVDGAGRPTFLTGGFGSAQTAAGAESGNYLSTGLGAITITFDTAQTALALLWGSIDRENAIRFGNAAGDVLTGATVQGLASGFAGNGFQGPAGSAYVSAVSDTPFTSVTLSSGVVSFEAAGVVGSRSAFVVAEPGSLALVGAGLAGLTLVRRRRVG